jgi:hypothetical protein
MLPLIPSGVDTKSRAAEYADLVLQKLQRLLFQVQTYAPDAARLVG